MVGQFEARRPLAGSVVREDLRELGGGSLLRPKPRSIDTRTPVPKLQAAALALTALASIDYFEQVERRDPGVRDYFRLYMLPGVMHCAGGPGPDQVDWLGVIAKWVEQGEAPERLVASRRDANGNVDMTRPLYPYPQRAKYSGHGSPKEAENFTLRDVD